MIGTNFTDDLDCGFFDQIDDLLDFPNEDVDAGLSAAEFASFPSIWTDQPESLPVADSVFSVSSNSDLSAEISVPYDAQLEWLSNFVDDSFSGGNMTTMMSKKEDSISVSISNSNSNSSQNRFQSSSPVSVLESSSSCEKLDTETAGPHTAETVTAPGKRGRARSKRPRPATFSPRPIQLISTNSSVNENLPPPKIPSDSENHAESRLLIKIPKQFNPENKKKKKMKTSIPSSSPPAPEEEGNQNAPLQPIRKCMHCEISKTPQWRAGPMGPKTLCNACGVRYKSGRLFPEYRPAASPTFVPSVHSNSHKKVVEMRNKSIFETSDFIDNSPELIPNETNPALGYI